MSKKSAKRRQLEPAGINGIPRAAAYLGLGEHKTRALAEAGELGGRRVGGNWLFSRVALDMFLAAGTEQKNASSGQKR